MQTIIVISARHINLLCLFIYYILFKIKYLKKKSKKTPKKKMTLYNITKRDYNLQLLILAVTLIELLCISVSSHQNDDKEPVIWYKFRCLLRNK